jgi:hypothetical protein
VPHVRTSVPGPKMGFSNAFTLWARILPSVTVSLPA